MTLNTHETLSGLGFVHAGAMRPIDGGQRCGVNIQDVRGFVIYAHVVGDQIKKFGITTPSLRSRVAQNVSTINQVIALAEGRAASDARWHHRPFDAFKRLAPLIIRGNQAIDVWALQSTDAEYRVIERELNARFDTLSNGWATRLG